MNKNIKDIKLFLKFLKEENIILIDKENNPSFNKDNQLEFNWIDNDLIIDLFLQRYE